MCTPCYGRPASWLIPVGSRIWCVRDHLVHAVPRRRRSSPAGLVADRAVDRSDRRGISRLGARRGTGHRALPACSRPAVGAAGLVRLRRGGAACELSVGWVRVRARRGAQPPAWTPSNLDAVLNWLEPICRRWLATRRPELFERLGLPDADTPSGFTSERLGHRDGRLTLADRPLVANRLDWAVEALGYEK
jgi:hypothetical protein